MNGQVQSWQSPFIFDSGGDMMEATHHKLALTRQGWGGCASGAKDSRPQTRKPRSGRLRLDGRGH